ncbi:2'-5' RNA ligase family protein [Microbacterium sp. NEAU-LLC]|uniref:2'-5' RNA ligase family protein n=1 Tax=Microbacterium helvum TaxID=2773713 RepID=A0ABR8NJR6_9MICO|nr:2'-5' RNA ligase family protein [Microbacterium helvum]MBD3940910.1 2'-5' RNA ligase family protein [Microbacterium helvum]
MPADAARELYVVVALPEPLSVAAMISRRAWPAHVTLASNFVVDGGPETVTRAVADCCVDEPPLRLRFAEQAWFGPRHDIAVQLVESAQIIALHERLAVALEALAGFGAETPEYWREGYRPHVTHVPGVVTSPGMTAQLRFLAIAVMTGSTATIISAIDLGRDAGGS